MIKEEKCVKERNHFIKKLREEKNNTLEIPNKKYPKEIISEGGPNKNLLVHHNNTLDINPSTSFNLPFLLNRKWVHLIRRNKSNEH